MTRFSGHHLQTAKNYTATIPFGLPRFFVGIQTAFCAYSGHVIQSAPGRRCYSSAVPSSSANETRPRGGSGASQESQFEVDWSIFSLESMSQGLKDLLLDIMGIAPPPPPNSFHTSSWIRRNAALGIKIEELYAQQRLQDVSERGYLVKGLIYDISALTCSLNSALQMTSPKREHRPTRSQEEQQIYRAQQAMRDWEGFVVGHVSDTLGDTHVPTSAPPPGEPGGDGGGAIGAVTVRKSGRPTPDSDTTKLIPTPVPLKPVRGDRGLSKTVGIGIGSEKEFEEVLGRGDSVRSKYEGRLREKRILADARQEGDGAWRVKGLGRLQLGGVGSDRTWVTTPGAATLLRHLRILPALLTHPEGGFQERGVHQGALLTMPPADVAHLKEELGSFRFNPTTESVDATGVVSPRVLQHICEEWGLEPKQVMMVVGSGKSGSDMRKAAANLGFFVCKLNHSHDHSSTIKIEEFVNGVTTRNGEGEGKSTEDLGGNLSVDRKKNGWIGWYSRLAEGTLHVDDGHENKSKESVAEVHFSANELRELKAIMEDLNGISYRKSVFIRNQDKREALSPAIVIKPWKTQTLQLKPT